jgi:AraC-like DNA-binding protein
MFAAMNLFLMSASAGVCFLFSFLLFFHPLKQNPAANRWLGLFVLIMGLAFINVYVEQAGYAQEFELLNKGFNAIQFLLPPCLFLSICYFTSPLSISAGKVLLNLLPFLSYVVLELIASFNGIYLFKQKLFALGSVDFLVADLLLVQNLLYVGFNIYILLRHQKKIKLVSSAGETVNLDWLLNFIFILIIIYITWVNDALLINSFLMRLTPYIYTFSLFFLAWFALRQKAIFPVLKKTELEEIAAVLEEKEEEQDSKPGRVEDEKRSLLYEQLLQLMEKEKLYLENELTLAQVAQRLNASIHDTSYLINHSTGSNFYSFVNKYRIEEAKRLLRSMAVKKLTVLGIAFEAGFNSKTAFNTAFKKETGMSPTQYAALEQKNG